MNGAAIFSRTRGLIGTLRHAGVETLFLFELFGKPRLRPQPYYLLRDTHWSGEAAQVAAEVAAARLQELGWVAAGDTPYEIRRLLVARRNDIARMSRAPLIEATFPPEQVDCEQGSMPPAACPTATTRLRPCSCQATASCACIRPTSRGRRALSRTWRVTCAAP